MKIILSKPISILTLGFILLIFSITFGLSSASSAAQSPNATPESQIASDEELTLAYQEWAESAHSDTYDNGMGSNTTCARCKSPKNWDPSADIAQQEALDCFACKRIPGAARPELPSGERISEEAWFNIGCDICHEPVGDSYYTWVSFWNGQTGEYEPVDDINELCAHCHEGRHGFKVIEEQELSPAHRGWDCTLCHGSHGEPIACTSCHDPTTGAGAEEHLRHPNVNCTSCHDAGGLTIWQDPDPQSRHYGEYITRRFAHTLTSWPSHNLQTESRCERCHHYPLGGDPRPAVVSHISCEACHDEGAGLFWCAFFKRDPDPSSTGIEPNTNPP